MRRFDYRGQEESSKAKGFAFSSVILDSSKGDWIKDFAIKPAKVRFEIANNYTSTYV